MSLKTQKGSSGKKGSKRSSSARCLLLLFAMELSGLLVLKGKVWIGEGLESRGLGEKARGTRSSYLWDW
jgi:hypothetical protein